MTLLYLLARFGELRENIDNPEPRVSGSNDVRDSVLASSDSTC